MNLRKAILFMMLSTMAFGCMNVLVKYLTYYSAYQLVFFRSLGSIFFTLGFLWTRGIPILGTHRKLLLLRSIVGVSSMLLFFLALHYMPIGTAVALRYISPIFAAIFAILILKEEVKPLQWLFFALAFLGVVVLKGFNAEIPLLGLLFIILASILSGLVYIIIRKIGTREHPVVIVNYFMCVATIVGGLLSFLDWKTPSYRDTLLLMSLGVFGFFGQLFMTKAFQLGEASVVAPFKYVEVLFAVGLGFSILGETYSLTTFLGMALIIGGMLLNMWYKAKYTSTG